jgi:hypothetical protein
MSRGDGTVDMSALEADGSNPVEVQILPAAYKNHLYQTGDFCIVRLT